MSAALKQNGRREYQKHGLYAAKRALMQFSKRAIDGRTDVAKTLKKWRQDLIRDLGGDASIQQEEIINVASKTKLLLDGTDAWIFRQPSLVNARKKALLPIVRERQALADSLVRYLSILGLERRVKQQTLEELLSQDNEEDNSDGEIGDPDQELVRASTDRVDASRGLSASAHAPGGQKRTARKRSRKSAVGFE